LAVVEFKINITGGGKTQLPFRSFVGANINCRLTMYDMGGAILNTMVDICERDSMGTGAAVGGLCYSCAYVKKMLKTDGQI
jgi:hypothetical protein